MGLTAQEARQGSRPGLVDRMVRLAPNYAGVSEQGRIAKAWPACRFTEQAQAFRFLKG